MTGQEEVRSALAERVGRETCLLTGRATSGIYAILQALDQAPGSVVIPDILCPSPANAVLYAGYTPLFCDVIPDDLTLDPRNLQELLDDHDVVGVIPAHTFGHPADMGSIMDLAASHDAFVIEDAAQSLGGSCQGRPMGSWGDASVVSFGHTKIIDVGDGGAVLTDDPALADRVGEALANLPAAPDDLQDLVRTYRKAYYGLQPLVRDEPSLHPLYEPLWSIFRRMYLYAYRPGREDELLQGLDGLDDQVARRRSLAARYDRALDHERIEQCRPRTGVVPWRYTFTLPGSHAYEVADALRATGADASNWYPPLHRWYASGRAQPEQDLQTSLRVGREVMNLWLDPGTEEDDVDATAEALLQILEKAGDDGKEEAP